MRDLRRQSSRPPSSQGASDAFSTHQSSLNHAAESAQEAHGPSSRSTSPLVSSSAHLPQAGGALAGTALSTDPSKARSQHVLGTSQVASQVPPRRATRTSTDIRASPPTRRSGWDWDALLSTMRKCAPECHCLCAALVQAAS
jgi:hypothetical protein